MTKKAVDRILEKVSGYERMFIGENEIVVGNIDEIPNALRDILPVVRGLCETILSNIDKST